MNASETGEIIWPFYSTYFIGQSLGLSAAFGMIQSRRSTLHGMDKTYPKLSVHRRNPNDPPMALVMDDEPELRDLVCAMLEVMGFAVKSAVNGAEGLKLYEEFAHQIELVMLDVAMPGISSNDILRKIHAAGSRDVRVFVMSGYSEGDAIDRCGVHRPEGYIAKPFSAARLKETLKI